MYNLKNIKGRVVKYVDYDGKIINGVVERIGFMNKAKTIVWLYVDFSCKAFLVPYSELIFENIQLELFNC